MAADSGIDPRYAAQFQRGFDPAVHAPTVDRRGPAPISAPPAPVVRLVPPPPPVVERPVAAAPAPSRPVEAPAEDDDAEEDGAPRRPRTEWALLATGAGFLILAGILFQGFVEISTRYSGVGSGVDEQTWALATQVFPGPLLVAGIVAVSLWIVLRTLRSTGRP